MNKTQHKRKKKKKKQQLSEATAGLTCQPYRSQWQQLRFPADQRLVAPPLGSEKRLQLSQDPPAPTASMRMRLEVKTKENKRNQKQQKNNCYGCLLSTALPVPFSPALPQYSYRRESLRTPEHHLVLDRVMQVSEKASNKVEQFCTYTSVGLRDEACVIIIIVPLMGYSHLTAKSTEPSHLT